MRECDLCGAPACLSLALLRIAWSTRSVRVAACPSCASIAWRTVAADVLASADPFMPMLPWGSPSRAIFREVRE